jgi:phage/plasmid-like protein (TIGR03299 family)
MFLPGRRRVALPGGQPEEEGPMAHLVEMMFSVRKTPWHGLGSVLDDPPTMEQGLRLAGLDWDVRRERLYTQDGTEAPAFAVVRESDNKVLGAVGEKYRPLQNREAFAWFEPFLMAGEANLETAGSLAGGSRVWVLAKLNRDPMVVAPGDEVEKFLLLSNSHDGSLAVRVGFTPIRVVCNNTLTLAHASKDSQLIRLKHSSGVVANLENVRDTVNSINARFEATAEQYRLLARKDINQADLRKYVQRVLDVGDKPGTRMANMIRRIEELFEAGEGNATQHVRGTYWAVYNAATEWLSHERGRSQDSRLGSLWYGDGAGLNARALAVALEMAG